MNSAVSASPATWLVHVSSTESREIHAFGMDAASGRLAPIETVAVPGTGAPTRGNIPLHWSRDGRVLYAQVRTAPFPLSAYALDAASGRLRLLGSADLPGPMAYMSTTRDGRFLLGASYDQAILTVHAIEADGRVAPDTRWTVQTPPKPHCIVEAPFGGFVYASTVDGEAILVFRLDAATGRLDVVAPAAAPSHTGPRHLVFHPRLDMLYCINEHQGSVTAYAVDRHTGALLALQTETIMPPGFTGRAMAADLHVTPDGRFVYASVRKTHRISAFALDPATGRMTDAGSFEVEPNPRGFAISPDGRFLLCAGQESHQLGIYAIDGATGALSLQGRHAVGLRPAWVEVVLAPAGLRA